MAGVPAADISTIGAMTATLTPIGDWLVIAPLVIFLSAGGLLLALKKDHALQWAVALLASALVILSNILLLIKVVESGPVVMTVGNWLPPYGITFAADIVSALFALVAAVVGLLGTLAARHDVSDVECRFGFYTFLMMMMAGVSGAFLAGDIFNLYVWFEVTLMSSFGLLVLGSRPDQLDGTLRYAFLSLIATTVFLLTTGYLYGVFGTLNMADIARKAGEMRDSGPVMSLAALFFFAFAFKAAAFPMNFWLPASYHTPKAVVSALFAGLLTKVGVYALFRTGLTLFPVELAALQDVFVIVAILTMIIGALGALAQNDIRKMIAFLVVSGIGSIFMGLALGQTLALAGALFYALHSMVAMAAFFLLWGIMQRWFGSPFLSGAGGLYSASPVLSAVFFGLILAVSGLPPFSGLWPKIMLVKAGLDLGAFVLVGALLLSTFLTLIAAGRLFLLSVWRPIAKSEIGESSQIQVFWPEWAALFGLSSLMLMAGLYPEPIVQLSLLAADWLLDPNLYINSVFPASGKGIGS